jgi:hypothetical protein
MKVLENGDEGKCGKREEVVGRGGQGIMQNHLKKIMSADKAVFRGPQLHNQPSHLPS